MGAARLLTGDVFSGTYCSRSTLASSGVFSCNGQVAVPSSLAPGTYYFGAIADDLGAVPETNEANNTRSTVIVLSAAVDTTPPTIPGSFTATAASASQINLSWSASTDSGGSGLAGYAIERCAGVGCTGFSLLTTSGSTSYSNAGLNANTSYSYRVRAYDIAGNYSGYSSTATATTLAIAVDTFPLNCHMPSGWTVPGTAQSGWSVVANEASEGTCSLKSNAVTDSQKAQIQFVGTFAAGNVSFSRKVSSEGG